MKLTILATSDIHGYIYPTDYREAIADQPMGLLKVSELIKNERKEAEGEVILIENGDFIQGSPLAQYVNEKTADPAQLVQALNELQVDAGVIGNHEFNFGLAYLKAAIAEVNHPVLSANIVNQEGGLLADKPAVILNKGDLKVAVLGLTTQYIPNWEHPETIKGLTFLSAYETAKKWVPKLNEEADIVIVSYHGGFESDLETGEPTERHTGENEGYKILTEIEGIDAFITGHQHREIEAVVNGVPVIQPGQRGEKIGKIVLEIEEKRDTYQVINSEATLLSTENVQMNEELKALYDPLQDEVNGWLDQAIGHTTGDMTITDPFLARIKKHPYIELINKVQLHYGKADISSTALFSDTVTGYGDEITIRDILVNYPFPNTLAVIQITGEELKAAIEQVANYFIIDEDGEIAVNPSYIKPKPQAYNYDMYEGVDYKIDVSKPVGERVIDLAYKGKNVEATDEFELVTNQYRAIGGGNFAMFEGKEFIREVNLSMSDLIIDYIQDRKSLDAEVNPNFEVFNGNHV